MQGQIPKHIGIIPDFREKQFLDALEWYQKQDVTLGG